MTDFNPEIYCPACGHAWALSEEVCSGCGLDPVNDEDDAQLYDDALALYAKMQEARRA